MKRAITSVVGLILLYLIVQKTIVLGFAMTMIYFIGAKELANILRKGWEIFIDFAVLSPIPFLALPPLFDLFGVNAKLGTLTAFVLLGLITLVRTCILKSPGEKKGRVAFACLFTGLYLGFLPSYIYYIREMENGRNLVLLVILTVAAVDVAAFGLGRTAKWSGFSHRMTKASPKKTWEGAIGGFLAGAVLAYSIIRISGMETGITLWLWIPFGMLLSVVAQYGDYFESKLKRRAAIKDSGGVIPGHGGILDRFDGHIVASPVAYYTLFILILINA